MPPSRFSPTCILWAKAIFETFTFKQKLTSSRDAYKRQSARFHQHRINTEPLVNVQKSPLKLTKEKIILFPGRSAEFDGVRSIWWCIV